MPKACWYYEILPGHLRDSVNRAVSSLPPLLSKGTDHFAMLTPQNDPAAIVQQQLTCEFLQTMPACEFLEISDIFGGNSAV